MQKPELFPLSVSSIHRERDQRRVQTYAVGAAHLEYALPSGDALAPFAHAPLSIPCYR
jgi:hypothetical protein